MSSNALDFPVFSASKSDQNDGGNVFSGPPQGALDFLKHRFIQKYSELRIPFPPHGGIELLGVFGGGESNFRPNISFVQDLISKIPMMAKSRFFTDSGAFSNIKEYPLCVIDGGVERIFVLFNGIFEIIDIDFWRIGPGYFYYRKGFQNDFSGWNPHILPLMDFDLYENFFLVFCAIDAFLALAKGMSTDSGNSLFLSIGFFGLQGRKISGVPTDRNVVFAQPASKDYSFGSVKMPVNILENEIPEVVLKLLSGLEDVFYGLRIRLPMIEPILERYFRGC